MLTYIYISLVFSAKYCLLSDGKGGEGDGEGGRGSGRNNGQRE